MPDPAPADLRAVIKNALAASEVKSAAVLSSPIARMAGGWTTAKNSKSRIDAGDPAILGEKYEIRAILNGRFLMQEYSAQIEGEQYSGAGYVGFDETNQEFIEEWKDSLGNVHRISTKDYDVSPSVITLRYAFSGQNFVSEWRSLTNVTWQYRLTDADSKEVLKEATFNRS